MLTKYLNFKNSYELGQNSFYLGTFFLGSALPISIIFYLVSIYIILVTKKIKYFKDKYNLVLLICTGIMFFCSIRQALFIEEFSINEKENIFINLFNWIPLFILFICSNFYLNHPSKRKTFSKFLIASTFPIILSCILQYWFDVHGVFKTFKGLIVWYMDKVDYSEITISGLFSNRNYTGIWLSSVLAFSFYEFKTAKDTWYRKLFITVLNLVIIYFTFFTFSRNAIIGIVITIIIAINKYRVIYPLILIYTFLNLIILNLTYNSFFISNSIKRLFILNIDNFLNFNRIEIFTIASKLIFESPIFGWGASTFPKMYELRGGIQSVQHSHNIILELAYNYGLPLSILLSGFVFFLIFNCAKLTIFKNSSNSDFLIDKYWVASSIVVATSHLSDITYYDGKVSILIWLLLSGLRCILKEGNQIIKNEEVIYNINA